MVQSLTKSILTQFLLPFKTHHKLNLGLILLYITINSLVLLNGVLHDPRVGYDAAHHLENINVLSQGRLVSPEESREFFSPPLPYMIPAVIKSITGIHVFWAGKAGQLINVLLSLGLTWYLIKLCRIIHDQPHLSVYTLAILAVLPVYYKTFAFVRGEPFVAFFCVLMVYVTLKMGASRRFSVKNGLWLGAAMGLGALSRQWAILFFPPIVFYLFYMWFTLPSQRKQILTHLFVMAGMIALISGWFYLTLYAKYGSFTAFNRPPEARFSITNQPVDFYFGTGDGHLFSMPVRPHFPNQLFPILYAETWGDYWGYFSIFGLDKRHNRYLKGKLTATLLSESPPPPWLETNYATMGAYLGRVNRIALLPFAVILAAFGFSIKMVFTKARQIHQRHQVQQISDPIPLKELNLFLLSLIGSSVAFYLWFLILYPNLGKGDTIKASYMLQCVPVICLITGLFLDRLRSFLPTAIKIFLIFLALMFCHNLPAMITQYSLTRLL